MAQKTAASMAVPDGKIWRAWLDAFLHPRFETYARWYLRMNARWRRTSLAASLPLLIAAAFVVIAHDAMHINYGIQTPTVSRFLSYLGSPHGLFELFALFAGAMAGLIAIPAVAAVCGHRSVGRYRARYYIAYCTFMQTLPIASLLVLFGAVGYYIHGFFDATSFIAQVAGFLFVYVPLTMAMGLIGTGMSAATHRRAYWVQWGVLVVYVVITLLVWHLLGHILVLLGIPVL